MKIGIIGDGGWGTANALLLLRNGHEVTLWGAFPDYVREMQETRLNRKFLPGVDLPLPLKLTSDKREVTENADVIVFAPPSKYFASVCESFRVKRVRAY